MYTKQQFIENVKKEAIALREHATIAEKDKLSFHFLDPGRYSTCIYGLMTGDCRSERASELIEQCCVISIKNESVRNVFSDLNIGVEDFVCEPGGIAAIRSKAQGIDYFSAIEAYIMYEDSKRKELVEYLCGTTNELNL